VKAESIKTNLEKIKNEIGQAKLVAVTKYSQVPDIQLAIDAGQNDFGENRVAELLEKAQALKEQNIKWHFIGKLQKNKINNLFKVPGLAYIHSVDSTELWQEGYWRLICRPPF